MTPPRAYKRSSKHKPSDVWLHINTYGGDKDVCWSWNGPVDKDGRPRFSIGGVRLYVSRLVWMLIHGVQLDEDTVLRHKCDNHQCVNPHHLETGTQAQNIQDMYDRQRRGMPHDIVRAIRRRLNNGEQPDRLAAEYGCSASMIRLIKARKRYANIKDEEDER